MPERRTVVCVSVGTIKSKPRNGSASVVVPGLNSTKLKSRVDWQREAARGTHACMHTRVGKCVRWVSVLGKHHPRPLLLLLKRLETPGLSLLVLKSLAVLLSRPLA